MPALGSVSGCLAVCLHVHVHVHLFSLSPHGWQNHVRQRGETCCGRWAPWPPSSFFDSFDPPLNRARCAAPSTSAVAAVSTHNTACQRVRSEISATILPLPLQFFVAAQNFHRLSRCGATTVQIFFILRDYHWNFCCCTEFAPIKSVRCHNGPTIRHPTGLTLEKFCCTEFAPNIAPVNRCSAKTVQSPLKPPKNKEIRGKFGAIRVNSTNTVQLCY